MTTNFPGSPDNFATDKTNTTPQVNSHPALHNNTAAALNAIEDFLMGFTPAVTNPDWGSQGAYGTGPGQFGTIPNLVADGVTDDTAALQAVIDAASDGDVILLPKGWIAVTHLTLNKSLVIAGAGMNSTFFIPLSGTLDCISVNVGQASIVWNVTLRDFGIVPRALVSPTITAGAMLAIGYIGASQINNIYISAALGAAPFVGVRVEAPLQTTFYGFISGCSSDGMLISPAAIGGDVNDFYILDGSRIDNNAGRGINMSNTVSGRTCAGVFVGHVSLWGNGSGILMSTAAGTAMYNILFKGTMIDSSTTGHGFEMSGATDIFNVECNNVWNAGNAQNGYLLSTTTRHMKILGGKVMNNGTNGIFLLYAHEVEIGSVELASNSQNANGIDYAIRTYDTTGTIQINDCKMWNNPDYANKQNGLHIAPNTNDVVVNGGLSITGVGTTPLFNAGTRTVFNGFLAGTTYSTATYYSEAIPYTYANQRRLSFWDDFNAIGEIAASGAHASYEHYWQVGNATSTYVNADATGDMGFEVGAYVTAVGLNQVIQARGALLGFAKNPSFKAIVTRSLVSIGGTVEWTVGLLLTIVTGQRDGIYFRSVNGANWFLVCRAGGVETAVDMGVTANTLTKHLLEFQATDGSTRVQGYVDGVGTGAAITTNIPASGNGIPSLRVDNRAATITQYGTFMTYGWGWQADR